MNCPKCQFENREGAEFCGDCGTKLETICPNCSRSNPPGKRFCDKCGTTMPLVALFCD
ncbi:MAG: zinc ribbon domain-containing protein [Dehalococcoidia bacterium]|nr:MAG: zinc ribbon domain-containing protein [Dehalococcoidia bacterium]